MNYAYLKFGPLSGGPASGLPPLIEILGYSATLGSITPQLLQPLAQNRTVRSNTSLSAKAKPFKARQPRQRARFKPHVQTWNAVFWGASMNHV